MIDAFDADVLIYAAVTGHPVGSKVVSAIEGGDRLVGSVLLLPEILSTPLREGRADEVAALSVVLSRLELRPLDRSTADLAVALGSRYGLRAADSVHLATAVAAGAERFITNNSKDFGRDITEVDVVYPADLT